MLSDKNKRLTGSLKNGYATSDTRELMAHQLARHVHAVSRQFRSIVRSECPRCGNVEHHRPLPISVYHEWEEFGERVERASICLQCLYRTRLREYSQAIFQVNHMSPFRRDMYLASGRCLNCGDVVEALQVHQNFLCRMLPDSHSPTPLYTDVESDSSS